MPPKSGRKKKTSKAGKAAATGEDSGSSGDERAAAAPAAAPGLDMKAAAEALKKVGNDAFTAGRFEEAVVAFTGAISVDPTNHIFFSNRSAANLSLGKASEAVDDAERCVELNPSWAKGYSRLGAALFAFGRFTDAVAAYAKGLAIEPTNSSLLEGLMQAQTRALGGDAAAAPASSAPKSHAHHEAVATSSSSSSSSSTDSVAPKLDTSPVIGIDLGTTFSCVGVWQGERVEILANEDGSRTTPSVVAFDGDRRLVGAAAVSQSARNPTNTIFDAKRLIGRSFDDPQVQADLKHFPFTVVADGDGRPVIEVDFEGRRRQFKPEEISAMVLEKMKRTAEAALGHPVHRAVITVPAYFSDAQRQATKMAGAIAGLEVLRIINEPTAAALAYGLDMKAKEEAAAAGSASLMGYSIGEDGEIIYDDGESAAAGGGGGAAGGKKGKKKAAGGAGGGGGGGGGGKSAKKVTQVLIFDLGGGTFDVSLLSIDDGIFEVKATGGDTHLGGEDFDNAVLSWAVKEVQRRYGVDVSADKRAMKRLRLACERCKRVLSTAEATSIEEESIGESGLTVNIPLSRAKFESLNEAPFERCIETVRRVLRDAAQTVDDVSDVVLVGGSTRIPKVQELLQKYFKGKELCKSINPDEAVAYGAAVQGAILSGQRHSATEALLLVDVTPLSLGIETTGRVMSAIIKRNTPIPVRKTKQYSTEEDYQDGIDVRVFEGERACTDDNNLLGEFSISGIERAKRGVPKIDVTFELDANGILTVTAFDVATRSKANISISNSRSTHSAEDVERMVEAAERMRAADEARLRVIEARNELDEVIYRVREIGKATASETLEDAADAAREWLDGEGQRASLETLKAKIRELERRI